ncbi:MAG TPA: hypothetical protein VGJ60_01055 [Chloroflexota bacterium]
MAEQPGAYTLLPWVRQGLSAAPMPADTLAPGMPSRVALPVELRVNTVDPVQVQAWLYGPGDVVGIERRQVVRTDPRPFARNIEPNYLAAIEFDRPDLPWMFTPAAADAQDRLRPWLVLVVLERQTGVEITAQPEQPLPVLHIRPPARPTVELPDLNESWAWAHAQVAGNLVGTTLEATLANNPERTVSRLLCPRRLDPNTGYLACVVPAFELGRRAGLGQPADDALLQPAWRLDDATLSSIDLPVYFSWEFTTGAEGDFESLVKRLVARPLPGSVGLREMFVGNADPDLPVIPMTSADARLGLEGALMSPQSQPHGFTNGFGVSFRQRLRTRLSPPTTATGDPLVTPPIYGGRHVNQSVVPADNSQPIWLRELNLDPRYRTVAAFGTAVVQQQQEQLMASAWEQVGEIQRANQLLRQAQVLRAAGQSVFRNSLDRLPIGSLLQVTRATHSRVLDTPTATLTHTIDSSVLPTGVVTPAFRRIARPRGPIVRHVLPPAQRRVRPMVQKLTGGTIMMVLPTMGGGLLNVDGVEARFRANGGTRPPGVEVSLARMNQFNVAAVPQRAYFQIRPADLPGAVMPPPPFWFPGQTADNFEARNLRAALLAHLPLVQQPTVPIPSLLPLPVATLKNTVMARLDPASTIASRVTPLISYSGPRDTRDNLEPVMAAPEFPQPMYAALADLSQDLLLPGLSDVPDETVALVQTNPRFVEAFMVGLNHEMARELLWRDYPTDQRGTYFRQFWDSRTQSTPALDIPPIHTWAGNRALGQNASAGPTGQVVLLMRGELLRRYPTAIVYAARAVPSQGQPVPGLPELYPIFQGMLDPDVRFVGFNLTISQARGSGSTDLGYFFVIQQQPMEARFGEDVDAQSQTPFLHPTGNSAVTARALVQPPFRVAIFARSLLP